MATIEVFDPAMCCSTGVCGTSVDPTLSQFAGDLEWIAAQGITVERATLSQEPGKFAANEVVSRLLISDGVEALPVVVVNGALRAHGRYPSRAELAAWADAAVPEAAPGATRTVLPVTQACCGGSGCC